MRQTDGSQLQYLRNRYYDPNTGRFTQEDPIGLAGGLNLYGFANGDPVNFSDPFRLRSCCLVLGTGFNPLLLMTPDAASNRRIAELDASMRPLANMAVNMMYAQGQPVRVVLGRRSVQEQDALFSIGRTTDLDRDPVTYARGGESAHNFGKAIDLYPVEDGSVVIPAGSDRRWQQIGDTGKTLGLRWGGDWTRPVDKPHLEMPGWRSQQ